MTREEAIEELTKYRTAIDHYFMQIAKAALIFGVRGEHIEEPLGLPKGALFQELVDIDLTGAFSKYTAVLENAAKGQLKPLAQTPAPATDDFFDRNNEVIIDG